MTRWGKVSWHGKVDVNLAVLGQEQDTYAGGWSMFRMWYVI